MKHGSRTRRRSCLSRKLENSGKSTPKFCHSPHDCLLQKSTLNQIETRTILAQNYSMAVTRSSELRTAAYTTRSTRSRSQSIHKAENKVNFRTTKPDRGKKANEQEQARATNPARALPLAKAILHLVTRLARLDELQLIPLNGIGSATARISLVQDIEEIFYSGLRGVAFADWMSAAQGRNPDSVEELLGALSMLKIQLFRRLSPTSTEFSAMVITVRS